MRGPNPRGQLSDLEGAQRGVILQEILEANRGGMSGWGVIQDTCGNSVDENLAPADIKTGRDMRTHIRQRGGNGQGEEVGGGRELVSRCVWTGENDQVPFGRPPAGRHPNTGEGRDRGESVIADTHEARGQDASLCLEGCVKRMTNEAEHKAGPRRGERGFGRLGRGLGLSLAGTLQCRFGGLRHGSGRGVGSGGLLRGRGSGRGRLGSRSRLRHKVWWGLLHLTLLLWLRGRGSKVLG